MPKKYYNDENTLNKNYGIYEYFSKERKNQGKTYGCVSDDKYLFLDDLKNHSDAVSIMREIIGEYSIYFSPFGSEFTHDKFEFYGKKSLDDKNLTIFQYECVLGVLEELKKYSSEFQAEVTVIISENILKKKVSNEDYTNIDNYIKIIKTRINELTMPKKGISNLKIFKLLKKENKKRKLGK